MRNRGRSATGIRAVILAMAALGIGAGAAAQDAASARRGSASFWGSAYYQAVGLGDGASAVSGWGITQEAGLSLNLRSGGLEFLGDLTVPIEPGATPSPEAAIRQLSMRFHPSEELTLMAGKQRLNWGNAKVFSAIDTLEPRANPLSLRPELPGVSGLKAVFIPADWVSLSLVALPDKDVRWSGGAGRIDILAEDRGLDLGLGAVKYSLAKPALPSSPATRVDRAAFVNDGSWSTGSLVVYEESQLSWGRTTSYYFPGMTGYGNVDSDTALLRADIGAMLKADIGLTRPATFILEYLYNGGGLSSNEARDFSSRYAGWASAGSPAGEDIPDAFLGIGDFRRHYVAGLVKDVALSRYILAGASEIFGIEGRFSRLELSLEWEATQEDSVKLSYERYWIFDDHGNEPTELLLLPFRSRVTLAFSASYQ